MAAISANNGFRLVVNTVAWYDSPISSLTAAFVPLTICMLCNNSNEYDVNTCLYNITYNSIQMQNLLELKLL